MRKKITITQQMLKDAQIELVASSDYMGGYSITQPYLCSTKNNEGRWQIQRPVFLNTAHHQYGKDKTYLLVNIKLKFPDYDKPRNVTIPLHRLVYVYFKGNYPEGYDIAHLDDDPFNCAIDNLEAMPHKDNIKDRKFNGANQFRNSTNWDDDQNEQITV